MNDNFYNNLDSCGAKFGNSTMSKYREDERKSTYEERWLKAFSISLTIKFSSFNSVLTLISISLIRTPKNIL